MAARENQTKAIVFDLFVVERSRIGARFEVSNKIFLYSIEARACA